MKKNKMLRLASVLLVLTLLSTSIIGGAFAKYTTQSTATDTARVATWGVTISAHTDLFATAYKDEKVDASATDATVKVTTSDTSNLVAPGTTGTGLSVKNTATSEPEVSYTMTIKLGTDAKMPTLKYTPTGESTAKVYEPVKFSVYNGTTLIKEGISLADLKTLFNGTNVIYEYDVAAGKYYLDKNGDGTIEASEKAAAAALTDCPDIQIKWEWEFENTAPTIKALNDELDTILGDTAAGSTITKYSGGNDNSISDINTDVSLSWTITATQIN